MKLNVKTTFTVNTDQLEIYCDPPLAFEAIGRIDDKTHRELVEWSKADYPAGQTLAFIPRLFLSVSQSGKSYPLSGEADAQALREATGDAFLVNLIEGFWNYEFRFFQRKLAASESSSTAQGAGRESEPQP